MVAGAGGIVGALTNSGVSKEEAEVYAEGVRRGGTLVSVKVADDKATVARAAIDIVAYVDIGVRQAAYREAGWNHFDETAAPYSDPEIKAERARWMPYA